MKWTLIMSAKALVLLAVLFAALPFGSARPVWQWLWIALTALVAVLFVFSIWHQKQRHDVHIYDLNSLKLPNFRIILPLICLLIGVVYLQVLFIPVDYPGLEQISPRFSEKGIIVASLFASHALLFLLVIACTPRKHQVYFFLKAIALTTTLYALYGLGAYLLDGEHVLWFKKTSNIGALSSTFINRNHYATFAGLGLLTTAAIIFHRVTRNLERKHTKNSYIGKFLDLFGGHVWLYFLCFCLLVVSLLLSGSRGGTVATLIGLCTLVFIISFHLKYMKFALGTLGLLSLIAFGGLSLSGEFLLGRFLSANAPEYRTAIYSIVFENWDGGYVEGNGLGRFDELFQLYRTEEVPVRILRAHNDYIEFAYGAGFIAFAMLLALVSTLVRTLHRNLSITRCDVAYKALGIAGTVLVGAHSVIDFPLQIPAISFLYVIMLGLAYSLCRNNGNKVFTT